jgi:hypothetical protein
VSRALGVPLLGVLPEDRKAAMILSDGAGARRGIDTSQLLRASGAAARTLARSWQPAQGSSARGAEVAAVQGRA